MSRERDPSFDERVAPTEVVPWRGGMIRGAVHDVWLAGIAARPATMASVQPITRIRFITGLMILAWGAAAPHQFVFR